MAVEEKQSPLTPPAHDVARYSGYDCQQTEVEAMTSLNRCQSIRNLCILAIVANCLMGAASLGGGLFVWKQWSDRSAQPWGMKPNQTMFDGYPVPPASQTPFFRVDSLRKFGLVPLAINAALTITNESIGYVHACSLRWSLQHVGRLRFNSNLRLFTSLQWLGVNGVLGNAISSICTIFVYAATSLIFLPTRNHSELDRVGSITLPASAIAINPVAMLFLALGLLGQALIGLWSLRISVPTWSSSPLDTLSARLPASVEGGQVRFASAVAASTKVMVSTDVAVPTQGPKVKTKAARQSSVLQAHSLVPWTVGLLWTLVVVAASCSVGLYRKAKAPNPNAADNWSLLPLTSVEIIDAIRDGEVVTGPSQFLLDRPHLSPAITIFDEHRSNGFSAALRSFAIIAVAQSLVTLTLSTVELASSLHRDELVWRRATVPEVTQVPAYNPLLTYLRHPPSVLLFAAKIFIHWLYGLFFGLAISPDFSGLLTMPLELRPVQLIALTISLAVVAVGVTALSAWRPKRRRRPTYGNLQVMADWTSGHAIDVIR